MPSIEEVNVFESRFQAVQDGHTQIVVTNPVDFRNSLQRVGADFSPDGTKAVIHKPTTLAALAGEKDLFGNHYTKGEIVLSLSEGEYIDIAQFLEPKTPGAQLSTQIDTFIQRAAAELHYDVLITLERQTIIEIPTGTYGHKTLTIAQGPEDASLGPAIFSTLIDGRKLVRMPLGEDQTMMLLYEAHKLISASIQGPHGEIPIDRYQSILGGDGSIWMAPEYDAEPLISNMTLLSSPIGMSGAILIREAPKNILTAKENVQQEALLRMLMNHLRDKLNWYDDNPGQHPMRLLQIGKHYPAMNHPLPIYVVTREMTQEDVSRMVATGFTHDAMQEQHTCKFADGSARIEFYGEEYTHPRVLTTHKLIQINLVDGQINPRIPIEIEISTHTVSKSHVETAGIFLFPENPLTAPDGTEVRVVVVTDTPGLWSSVQNFVRS